MQEGSAFFYEKDIEKWKNYEKRDFLGQQWKTIADNNDEHNHTISAKKSNLHFLQIAFSRKQVATFSLLLQPLFDSHNLYSTISPKFKETFPISFLVFRKHAAKMIQNIFEICKREVYFFYEKDVEKWKN